VNLSVPSRHTWQLVISVYLLLKYEPARTKSTRPKSRPVKTPRQPGKELRRRRLL